MVIKINGKDMKDAVIKTDQFEMKILDISGDSMKVSVKDISGEPFNFVPRFMKLNYPNGRSNTPKSGSAIVVRVSETIDHTVVFKETIHLEKGVPIQLFYAMKKLADIVVQ